MGICSSQSPKKQAQSDQPRQPTKEQQPLEIEQVPNPENAKYGRLLELKLRQNYFTMYEQNGPIDKTSSLQKVLLAVDKTQVKVARTLNVYSWQNEQLKLFNLFESDHPNLLAINEVYQEMGQYYMIQDFLPNGNYIDYMPKTKKEITDEHIAVIIKQLISALVYLHERDLVHGSLQFDKVLAVGFTHIRLTGFALPIEPAPPRSSKPVHPKTIFKAPEQLTDRQNIDLKKADIWACGIILYRMVTGAVPFEGKNESQIQQEISKGVPLPTGNKFKSCSAELKEFLTLCLAHNPAQRPSARQLLQHPWIKNARRVGDSVKLPHDGLLSLRQVNVHKSFDCQQYTKLQQVIMQYMLATIIPYEEKDILLKQFLSLNKKFDGMLTREELIEGFAKKMDRQLALNEVDLFYSRLDSNASGDIGYQEFVYALITKKKAFTKVRLTQAFKSLDQVHLDEQSKDKDGQLSKDQIDRMLRQCCTDEEEINDLFNKADMNKDGNLSLKEFTDMMDARNTLDRSK